MTWVIIAVIVIVAVFVIVALASTLLGSGGDSSKGSDYKDCKYQRRGPLLTENERKFYSVLLPIASTMGYFVFVKVNLGDLIEPQRDLNKSQKQTSRNKIDQKHVDFILCEKTKLNPVLVIELDDSSHNNPKNQKKDTDKNNALKSAGLPILRTYNANNLEKEIMNKIQPAKVKK